ncbi:DUF2398 family protein [Victivallis vadensis]|uniref:DUF2398 family protein n=1 Tax=Victivallis vadensis TaxID=172901 RepID=UPI00307D8F91
MNDEYLELLKKYPDRFIAVNNILTEAAWFYKTDEPELFYELQHYESAFRNFYKRNFDWELRIDGKCARLVKNKVYNPELGNTGIVEFKLRGRDEYIAFLLLIEFYEKMLSEQSLSASDRENPTFIFGEYLDYVVSRMTMLFPERKDIDAESVKKKILRPLMEKLIDYRFLRALPRDGERIEQDKTIYEALPACCQYNAGALEKNLEELHHAD